MMGRTRASKTKKKSVVLQKPLHQTSRRMTTNNRNDEQAPERKQPRTLSPANPDETPPYLTPCPLTSDDIPAIVVAVVQVTCGSPRNAADEEQITIEDPLATSKNLDHTSQGSQQEAWGLTTTIGSTDRSTTRGRLTTADSPTLSTSREDHCHVGKR